MMDLKIPFKKLKSGDKAYEEIKKSITPELINKFKVSADLDYDDEGKKIQAKGRGFDLSINFTDEASVVDLNLSLLLRPIKKKVLSILEKEISKII